MKKILNFFKRKRTLIVNNKLTVSEQIHNDQIDFQIQLNKMEDDQWQRNLNRQRDAFEAANPDFPKDKLKYMFINVKAPKQICAIYYV